MTRRDESALYDRSAPTRTHPIKILKNIITFTIKENTTTFDL